MRSERPFLLVLALLVLLAGAQVRAQDSSCTTSDCHGDKLEGQWIHGPVGVGACTVCHNPVDGEDHEFRFAAEKQDLCFACHERSRDMMLLAHQHTPVVEGNCTGCHDPHGSEYRFTLKGEAAELCFQCHDTEKFTDEHVHGPVAAGDCNACHNPHASEHPRQLLAAPEEICFRCHEERDDIRDLRNTHAPVAENCANCHRPHAAPARFLLPDSTPDLCYRCHAEILDYAAAANQHEPVQNGRCGECHAVHGSPQPALMIAPQSDVCFGCHSDLAEYLGEQDIKHGPVQQDDCIACHDPHGSNHHRILKKYFPAEFYVPYAEENYAICFECHNRQVALEAQTETLTDFRDDDLNLHHLHVNKLEKGRSCRACHHAHASSQEKHIRLTVPYGAISWELPVNFTRTESGGSCEVGCHGPKEYRR